MTKLFNWVSWLQAALPITRDLMVGSHLLSVLGNFESKCCFLRKDWPEEYRYILVMFDDDFRSRILHVHKGEYLHINSVVWDGLLPQSHISAHCRLH